MFRFGIFRPTHVPSPGGGRGRNPDDESGVCTPSADCCCAGRAPRTDCPPCLAALALGVPPEQFLRGEWNRWLMRHALRGRERQGFSQGTHDAGHGAAVANVLAAVAATRFGDVCLFRIHASLEHRALPVKGVSPRCVFGGWFCIGKQIPRSFSAGLSVLRSPRTPGPRAKGWARRQPDSLSG